MPSDTLIARPTYDPLLRAIHAWNGLAILALAVSSQVAELVEHGPWEAVVWRTHILAGYLLIGGLVARLFWGLVGPRFARWSDLWHPQAWLAVLRGRFSAAIRQGHDARASGVFLALYAILVLMAGSGLVLAAIKHDMGPLSTVLGEDVGLKHLFKEPHEAGFALVLAFIALHLGALAWHRFVLRIPVGQAMVTGMQLLPQDQADA